MFATLYTSETPHAEGAYVVDSGRNRNSGAEPRCSCCAIAAVNRVLLRLLRQSVPANLRFQATNTNERKKERKKDGTDE